MEADARELAPMADRMVGFYVAEIVAKPECMKLPCNQLLCVSNCIGVIHPQFFGWQRPRAGVERESYRERLGLTEQQIRRMENDVKRLEDRQLIDADSRFVRLDDACDFYSNYMGHLSNVRVVGLSTDAASLHLWQQEDMFCFAPPADGPVQGTLLGGDILGYEGSSFHSYLCNGLEEDIAAAFDWRVGELGLMENAFADIAAFARFIAGQGEPVTWVPVLLRDCTPSAVAPGGAEPAP